MKRFIKCIVFVLCVIMLCGSILPVCQIETTQAAVRLNRYSVELVEGKTFQLKLKSNNKKKITWTSKNKKVATVNKRCLVTAVKTGKTKIVVKQGNYNFTCNVKVTPNYAKNISYEPIEYHTPSIKNSLYLLKIKNDNDCNVSVRLKIKSYDKDGYYIGNSEFYYNILKNNYIYCNFYVFNPDGKAIKYIVELDAYKSKNYIKYKRCNDSYSEIDEIDQKYICQDYVLTNKSKSTERYNLLICYFDKFDNIVKVENYYDDIPSNESIKITARIPDIFYNKYNIVRSEAYVY